ncbi:nuclear transport factor 2 family protein [Nocardia tengchongensis]|uniref:ester cyclase n=1 Tax=Nocardia tengchongensis TaxID=2055889 RepID=UPI0033DF7C27
MQSAIGNFYSAYADRDVERMMAWVSHDIVEQLSGIGLVSGRDDERRFLQSLFDAFPNLETTVIRQRVDASGACVEWRRRGTFSGSDFQGIPATGSRFELTGLAYIDVHAGLITRINGYYDTAEFARAIGFLPARGGLAERVGMRVLRLKLSRWKRPAAR